MQPTAARASTPCRSVCETVDSFAEIIVEPSYKKLPGGEYVLQGYVLHDARPSKKKTILTVLDLKNHEFAIEVILPASVPPPARGGKVEFVGRLDLYRSDPTSLKLQLQAERWEPLHGVESWADEWRSHLERLRAEHRPARLSRPAEVVAVVSGGASSVRGDFFQALSARPAPPVRIVDVNAYMRHPASIAAGIRDAAAGTPDVEVVVIIRGGGSAVELNLFNHPAVLDAIHEVGMRIPIITGIGHEADRTFADELAGAKCDTPTAAGTWLGNENERLRRRAPAAPPHVAERPGPSMVYSSSTWAPPPPIARAPEPEVRAPEPAYRASQLVSRSPEPATISASGMAEPAVSSGISVSMRPNRYRARHGEAPIPARSRRGHGWLSILIVLALAAAAFIYIGKRLRSRAVEGTREYRQSVLPAPAVEAAGATGQTVKAEKPKRRRRQPPPSAPNPADEPLPPSRL